MSGLGEPRGPEFVSPLWSDGNTPPPAPAGAVAERAARNRKWPLIAAVTLAVVGVSAGTGGAAGYVTGSGDAGRDETAAAPSPPPAAGSVPGDLVGAAARARTEAS